MKGLSISQNAMNFTAIRLHYSCDSAKDPATEEGSAWYDNARRLFSDPNAWETEMEINFFIASGTRVFPEFYETLHAKPHEFRSRKVIYRAWDFGWHAPACLVAQVDTKDRLCVFKELVGNQQTTRSFAQTVLDRCADWFPNHTAGFQDFCDPAGQQAQPAANEKSEVRDVEVLETMGIFPKWEYGWSRKDGRALIHQLLRPRTDGTPSIYVDGPGCPVLMQGFLGKYVYPESKDGRAKDEPDEGNHPWADTMAALRYLCTGLYTTLGLRRFRYQPVMETKAPTFHGYGTAKRRSG